MEEPAIISTYRRLLFIALVAWTFLVAIAALFYWNDQNKQIIALAKNTAVTALNKDLAVRSWVISHGGVYVPVTDKTPPNPYLSHIPERDIQTSSGQHLTLMNSSYVLRQMIENYGPMFGEKTGITSLKPLNADNLADAWETKALNYLSANRTKTNFYELEKKESGISLRMLIPRVTEEYCLKCHKAPENKIGEIAGGIDIAVPLKPFTEMTREILFHTYGWLSLIWFLGTGAIIVAFRIIRKKVLELHAKEIEKIKNYRSMISLIVDLIDKRDSYTAGHSQRVSQYCEMIASALSYDESNVNKIHEAAVLHDVGKIAIPDSILLKPGNLNPVEKELIHSHLTAGYELLSKVDAYHELSDIIHQHHERYDGKGYPDGLSGEQIHPLARIMIVADAFDAMTTDRIYKPRKRVADALKEIESQKGFQFDPEVVDAASTVLRDVTIKSFNQLPKTEIEEERFAYYFKDQLTDLSNHRALESILQINQHSHEYHFATVIILENLEAFNRQNGWDKGNVLLNRFGTALKNGYPHYHIYRIFGYTFVVLSHDFLVLSSDSFRSTEFLETMTVSTTVSVIHLIKEKIDSIKKLEEIIHLKSLKPKPPDVLG